MAKSAFREDASSGLDTGSLVVSDPTAAAEAALDDALEYAAQKMKLAGPQSVLDHMRAGDEAAHGYFQYALARQVAAHLASFDAEIKAAYLYDYEATPEDMNFGEVQPVSPLHLIVWVDRKTEALYSLISALDRALAAHYAARAGMPNVAHLLDVQAVDGSEVQRGIGYGALLSSIHHRPMLVWER